MKLVQVLLILLSEASWKPHVLGWTHKIRYTLEMGGQTGPDSGVFIPRTSQLVHAYQWTCVKCSSRLQEFTSDASIPALQGGVLRRRLQKLLWLPGPVLNAWADVRACLSGDVLLSSPGAADVCSALHW